MQTPRKLRNRLLAAAVFLLILAPAGTPAHAVSKEIIELQTQVQQLLDMVQRMQSTLDTRFGVLQNLAQQTADQATQMTAAVNALQQKLNASNDAVSGKVDTVSGQVQSLNDSVDELKTRIAKLDKTVQDLQAQLQNIQSQPAPTAPAGTASPQSGPATQPVGAGQQPGETPGVPGQGSPAASQAPPLQESFQAAVRDYNAAHYQVAAAEFQDVVHYYPLDDLAGTAQFYLGEIAYQQQDYANAVNAYNAVLEGFSGNSKAPAAQLHKGLALLAMNKREAGIRELRLLIQRHPQTPEATKARSKLNALGVKINAR
jgi:TolA-binding protein